MEFEQAGKHQIWPPVLVLKKVTLILIMVLSLGYFLLLKINESG